jgi:hypothetical protein
MKVQGGNFSRCQIIYVDIGFLRLSQKMADFRHSCAEATRESLYFLGFHHVFRAAMKMPAGGGPAGAACNA